MNSNESNLPIDCTQQIRRWILVGDYARTGKARLALN